MSDRILYYNMYGKISSFWRNLPDSKFLVFVFAFSFLIRLLFGFNMLDPITDNYTRMVDAASQGFFEYKTLLWLPLPTYTVHFTHFFISDVYFAAVFSNAVLSSVIVTYAFSLAKITFPSRKAIPWLVISFLNIFPVFVVGGAGGGLQDTLAALSLVAASFHLARYLDNDNPRELCFTGFFVGIGTISTYAGFMLLFCFFLFLTIGFIRNYQSEEEKHHVEPTMDLQLQLRIFKAVELFPLTILAKIEQKVDIQKDL